MYLKHQLYVRALIAYQKLETVSGKLNAAEQIQVLYHIWQEMRKHFWKQEEGFLLMKINVR